MRDRLRLSTPAGTLAAVVLLLLAACSGPKKAADSPAAAAPETSAASAPKARDLTLDPAQRQKIRLEKVAITSFRRTIETTGTVAFDQNRATQVLSPISGPVARIQVEVGARVGRGQALATVASPDFAADVSALRKAEALAKNARRVAELDQQLWKNDAIARRDMEQAETDAVSAEADRDAALQQLRDLGVDAKTVGEIQQNKSTYGAGGLIRSPLSGTVVEKLITPGQLLQAGTTPCFTVADLSTVWVMANIFETDLPFVAPGDTARVIAGGPGGPVTGKVDYISALVDPTTRAIAVRIVAPNPREALKRDLYVRVEIQASRESKGLLVPVSAILRDDENLPFVFVAKDDGSFPRRRVEIGPRMGDRQEITSGLSAGETVVAEGGLFLQTAGGS
ncbi:MAG TPA: efflux RND transporter periplasmic adaptor subunit [Thermoanaerobaculia bacterium]|nr:efflux RND transporter periplasmic adaptor subunit [Thermoanaerobaculia bacterium]